MAITARYFIFVILNKIFSQYIVQFQRVTGEEELEELYQDLKLHDRYEAELKKMLAENLDEDGTREEMVLENYKRMYVCTIKYINHLALDTSSYSFQNAQNFI